MGTLSHVLHAGARPIGVHEFAEALQAISPPRFPTVLKNPEREVGVAVSGGVDSMALVYLCTRLMHHFPDFRISDSPVSSFRAIVVDHRLRDGSREEAVAVSNAVRQMGMASDAHSISWSKAGVLGQYKHPKDLPNFESVARRLRYRKLGSECSYRRSASLLLAHHEDDQYETVLMRLLLGHGVRGLRGMKAATHIPECEGLYGVGQSGSVDYQRESSRSYTNVLARDQHQWLRQELRSDDDHQAHDQGLRESIVGRLDNYDFEELHQPEQATPVQAMSANPASIDVEDGGVMIYRPLLEFSKDRLIATCEANKIPWWEDSTNQDRTLTMRNAVRHMYKDYTLPIALQKPSILALSRRCEQKARALEAEADRLLAQTIIHDVQPNVGTASVQFPVYDLSRFPRDTSSPSRRRARMLRQREVAGLLIKRIIALVTPEEQTVPLASLGNVISRLFPALSNSPAGQSREEPPKAFVIADVHFIPIDPSSSPKKAKKGVSSQSAGKSLVWYLSRTPYRSDLPIPRYRMAYHSSERRAGNFSIARSKWSRWMRWVLWDGRFWMRIRHRLPYRVILQPFERSHAKAFRESLSPEDRDRLGTLLKRYAPGKTRFTLPALYLEEDLDLENPKPRRYYPLSPAFVRKYYGKEITADPTSDHPMIFDVSKTKLIALPSLDIQIPHLESWLEFEIRYRRIDRATLETAGLFHRGPFVSPRSLRAVPTTAAAPKLRRISKQRKWRFRRGRHDDAGSQEGR
ncbi:adenine nucleotide alpha hydrolases-like protein [Xylaria sp. FL1777]|nr:adenine nucleotide alpha hydrolases-like protein [Xylaria sp. FL1777]